MFNSYRNTIVDIAKFIIKIKNNNLLFISNLSFEVDEKYMKKASNHSKDIVQLKTINIFDV